MKKLLSLLMVLPLLLMSISCSRKEVTPTELVLALSGIELPLPDGQVYRTDAAEGDQAYLPWEMLTAAYGFPSEYDGIISAAIWLSTFCHPCEFAVFHCKTDKSAEDVALFCRVRTDILKSSAAEAASFCGLSADEYLGYVNNAAVIISGRYVALIISSDIQAAKKLLFSSL